MPDGQGSIKAEGEVDDMYKTDSKRIPGKDGTPDKSLIGKYVKITSNASHKNHKKIGRIIGFTKKGDYIKVYIGETKCRANFCRGSLELLN